MSFLSFREFEQARRAGTSDAQSPGSLRSWVLPATALVAIEYLFALLIGAKVGFRYRIPFGDYAVIGAGTASAGVAIFIVRKFIGYAIEGERRPAPRLLAEFPRCLGFVIGTVLVAVQMAVLTWTKIMLPLASPFWADPLLANVDHAIFRVEPWKIAEALFGWASQVIDGAYASWIFVKFAMLAAVLAAPESRRKARVLLAYFLIMAFTAIGQYALSSGGPIFYQGLGFGNRFAALPVEPWVRGTSSYLWHDYLRAGGDIGTGISAMPSLHVAIALWIALTARAYTPRWAFLGLGYFMLVLIGSVLLGWHYAADTIVACLIAGLSWRMAPPMAGLGRRPTAPPE